MLQIITNHIDMERDQHINSAVLERPVTCSRSLTWSIKSAHGVHDINNNQKHRRAVIARDWSDGRFLPKRVQLRAALRT